MKTEADSMVHFGNEWDKHLAEEFHKRYYVELRKFLKDEYDTETIFPPAECIFNALKTTDYPAVKVVILGQDPYHGRGQAHGLCFSVQKGCKPPPSLVNMFKELEQDLGIKPPGHGELTAWAQNGVLLLNTVLTVRESQANSHKGKGWEHFTDKVISQLNERAKPIVFMLWGANAGAKQKLITAPQHLILRCAHPSPLSAFNGFFGCRHFSKANAFLVENGMEPVNWEIV